MTNTERKERFDACEIIAGYPGVIWNNERVVYMGLNWLARRFGDVSIEMDKVEDSEGWTVKVQQADGILCNFGETLCEAVVRSVLTVQAGPESLKQEQRTG